MLNATLLLSPGLLTNLLLNRNSLVSARLPLLPGQVSGDALPAVADLSQEHIDKTMERLDNEYRAARVPLATPASLS